MRRRTSTGERVWEEKTQDMEESCTFWGAMSHSGTGEAGGKAAM